MRLYDRKAGENAMSTFSSVVDWPEELATDKTGPDGRLSPQAVTCWSPKASVATASTPTSSPMNGRCPWR